MENQNTLNRQNILIIDDDQDILNPLSKSFKDSFNVTIEHLPANALDVAIEKRPHLILLDLIMPNIDGFGLLRQFRTHPATSSIPVICMSSEEGEEARERAFSLGATGFFQKPLNYKTIGHDLQVIYKTINSTSVSPSGKKTFTINFNGVEKTSAIKNKISELLKSNMSEKVVLLTLESGKDFEDSEMKKWIEDRRLIFLQTDSTLVTKFPYLQDLSPVVSDIQGFMEDLPSAYSLILDDFHLIVNFTDPKSALGRLHLIKEEFSKLCKQMFFFSVRPNSKDDISHLNEFADIICR